jgi:small redox-active disulfide protein 2
VEFERKVIKMKIQIAGGGCQRCNETEMNVFNACAELDIAADISHVWETEEHAKLGVRAIPAVIVNGKIVISGRVPTVEELKRLLQKEMQ